MDLIAIYSSLGSLPKEIMEIIWCYLRPDAQRKLSMTCVKFNDLFHMDKNLKIPDLNSLVSESISKKSPNHTEAHYTRKLSRWQLWVNESTEISDKVFRWRWERCHVRLEIIFLKIEYGYLITGIRAQYQTPKDRDYSFSEFDIRPKSRMSYCYYKINNNVHGPKFKNLSQESIIYQQLSRVIKNWISNEKVRYLLNPICQDALTARYPITLKFSIKNTLPFGLKCDKCKSEKLDN